MATPLAAVTVARILSASTHYDVLELASSSAPVPIADVRRKYKELAVRVHPDKNRANGAADAFKRLSEAYECLSDERSQRAYYEVTFQRRHYGQKSKPRPPPPPPCPHFPTKQRAKKRPPPPPPPPPPTKSPTPRRWRTPEEVWSQFQREEEEQAKREFQERGFEREYTNDVGKRKRRRREQGAESPSRREDEVVTGERADAFNSNDIETRAQGWTAWKQSQVQAEQLIPASSSTGQTTAPTPCCLLCRRKFPNAAALARHEQLSVLHKENLIRKATDSASS